MQKETLALHAGYDSKEGYASMAVPIYQTTAYNFGTTKLAAKRFLLEDLGQIYSRITNPTVEVFEKRVAILEDGASAIAVSSGQAAIFAAVINIAHVGDNILVSDKIYSNVLLNHTLKNFGITSKLFDAENPENLETLIDENTKAIFFESLSNPQISVAQTKQIADIANKHKLITIVDNTVATPVLFNPIKHGVDIVVHSASKYISGQGLTISGVIISSAKTNDKLVGNKRYAHFNEPDPSYHGLVYAELKDTFDIYTLKIRFGALREIGITLSAMGAFQLIQGLETLDLRVRKHSENALKVAQWLEKHPKVKKVNYPGLKSSKHYNYIKENFTNSLASGLLSFELDSFDTAVKVIDNTKIFSVVVNIGDSKSIITHPASSTHSQLSQEELKRAGFSKELVRISVGLENINDLLDDLDQALK
ncbi:MAG: aminotransferase class I/II-fold pyridoxal phosphate-dependent enzyme [Campylobacter sp.]|nr:aminotransferase class I/II-fold pyridoxal phosphate-dependent enzyme [Campylobacter sp.]